jgi:hypothetical protein
MGFGSTMLLSGLRGRHPVATAAGVSGPEKKST